MKNKTLLYDAILISATVIAAVLLILTQTSKQEPGTYVSVETENKTVGIYPLDSDGTYVLNNGSNTLVIKDGFAMITEADCPNHDCVKQGKINKSGQTIVCLPNKLTVTVHGNDGEIDLVL